MGFTWEYIENIFNNFNFAAATSPYFSRSHVGVHFSWRCVKEWELRGENAGYLTYLHKVQSQSQHQRSLTDCVNEPQLSLSPSKCTHPIRLGCLFSRGRTAPFACSQIRTCISASCISALGASHTLLGACPWKPGAWAQTQS